MRTLKILAGAVLTISILFGAVFVVDFFAKRPPGQTSEGKEFLKPADPEKPAESPEAPAQEKESSEKYQSFFKTLRKKSRTDGKPDIDREQDLLRMARKKSSAIPAEEKPLPPANTAQTKTPSAFPELTYTIQLGSFQRSGGARSFSEMLAEKGYEPHIIKVSLPGKGTVYRVRIGRFKSMEQAQVLAKKIEKKEKIAAFITSK